MDYIIEINGKTFKVLKDKTQTLEIALNHFGSFPKDVTEVFEVSEYSTKRILCLFLDNEEE